MSLPSSRRSRWFAISLLVLAGALLLPTTASAAKETFHRFEVEGTANYTLTEDCPDGTTAQTRVTVIGGHEEESEEGITTLDSDFLTVLIRGFDCDFNLINDRGSGPAEFTFSSGLERASVTATIETEAGRTVTADIAWERHRRARDHQQHHHFPASSATSRARSEMPSRPARS